MDNIACHLVFYMGPRKGDAEAFHTARLTIGRAGSCDFRLDIEPVAAQHAEILLEDNVYRLYDLGSKAGTYVNGEKVNERCTLESEDYLRFGKEGPEVIFRIGEPKPGKQPLPQIFPVTAELEFFSGSDAGRIFPINAAVITNVGRRAELEIPLDPRGDMIVSGNHCNIRYLDGHFVLSDTSRNGTYVNGDLVEQPMEILDGDVIMLGDGGPQARFRVDLAKRHYPNHRVLSPVRKPEAQTHSALPKKPVPAPGPLLASAAPYESGTARTDLPSGPDQDLEAAAAAAGLTGAGAGIGAGAGAAGEATGAAGTAGGTDDLLAGIESEDESKDASPEAGAEAATAETGAGEEKGQPAPAEAGGAADVPGRTRPATVPLSHKLGFKPGKKVILAAVAVVVIIAIIAMLPSGDDEADTTAAGGGDYATALAKLEPVENPAGYTVKLPEGWTKLSQDNKVSAESSDKKIAVDYVRDPRLSEAKARQMLATDGADVNPDAQDISRGDTKIKMMDASIGSVRRLAVLHQPAAGPAALAMLETNEATLKALDEETINKLLVDNVELAAVAAPAAETTPTPAPTAEAELPAPAAVTPAATETAAATATQSPETPKASPAPTATPAPTEVAAPATTSSEETVASVPEGMKTVESKALKLSVLIPEEWTGESEESDAMVALADGQGLEIRIARDPGDLDPKGTFDAMVSEGWKKDGTKTDPRFSAAEFSKDDQNLMLGLIPEKAKTTLVVYATSSKDFTDAQRRSISQIIGQLVAPQ